MKNPKYEPVQAQCLEQGRFLIHIQLVTDRLERCAIGRSTIRLPFVSFDRIRCLQPLISRALLVFASTFPRQVHSWGPVGDEFPAEGLGEDGLGQLAHVGLGFLVALFDVSGVAKAA